MVRLSTALGDYPHFEPIKQGRIVPNGFELEQGSYPSLLVAIREMCRERRFDVCEMPVMTYLVGREAGLAVTAIPVFPLRQMPHRHLVSTRPWEPQQLEGRRVGVRTYTATSGVWVRGLLAREYGVDCDRVTWVVVDEEHIGTFRPPANVLERRGEDLKALLLAGEIDAAVGVAPGDGIAPLLPRAAELEIHWREAIGLYPINHTVVVRSELLAQGPRLATELFNVFQSALEFIGADSDFSYGLGANRGTLQTLARFGREQHILKQEWKPEDLFA